MFKGPSPFSPALPSLKLPDPFRSRPPNLEVVGKVASSKRSFRDVSG